MEERQSRLLVLGASGMLGNAVLRWFAREPGYRVFGSLRSTATAARLHALCPQVELLTGCDVENSDSMLRLSARVRPQLVINCVGLVKQLAEVDDPLAAIPLNALLPHRLAAHCAAAGARLIHISTDCVFAGTRGAYREQDVPDAADLYGRSKLLGEVDAPHALTLRTSIIGHELSSQHGLVAWFLSQQGQVRGYRRALFSGLPTVELARVIQQHVLPHPELHGLYHVASAPISKHELLGLVAAAYGRDTGIVPDDALVIDRSLNADRFAAATGYRAPEWPELVRRMREFG